MLTPQERCEWLNVVKVLANPREGEGEKKRGKVVTWSLQFQRYRNGVQTRFQYTQFASLREVGTMHFTHIAGEL